MSSQKLTVLKTQIKVISNPYESPYEIYQVLSIRRRCLRAITKAPFKQTDVFTLYVSCFCVRFTAVPTAKQNTTPVIHVNWERHQTSSNSTLARGPQRPDLHWCLWLSSSLEFDRRSLILNCLIVFACVQIGPISVFTVASVFIPVFTSSRPSWAALSQRHPASYSQFDTFTAAICQRRAAIWGWDWGSWASLWHVFTSRSTSLLQVDVFPTWFSCQHHLIFCFWWNITELNSLHHCWASQTETYLLVLS